MDRTIPDPGTGSNPVPFVYPHPYAEGNNTSSLEHEHDTGYPVPIALYVSSLEFQQRSRCSVFRSHRNDSFITKNPHARLHFPCPTLPVSPVSPEVRISIHRRDQTGIHPVFYGVWTEYPQGNSVLLRDGSGGGSSSVTFRDDAREMCIVQADTGIPSMVSPSFFAVDFRDGRCILGVMCGRAFLVPLPIVTERP